MPQGVIIYRTWCSTPPFTFWHYILTFVFVHVMGHRCHWDINSCFPPHTRKLSVSRFSFLGGSSPRQNIFAVQHAPLTQCRKVLPILVLRQSVSLLLTLTLFSYFILKQANVNKVRPRQLLPKDSNPFLLLKGISNRTLRCLDCFDNPYRSTHNVPWNLHVCHFNALLNANTTSPHDWRIKSTL